MYGIVANVLLVDNSTIRNFAGNGLSASNIWNTLDVEVTSVVFEATAGAVTGRGIEVEAVGDAVMNVDVTSSEFRHLTEGGPPWPIVFLTGHGDIPMSVHAMKAGAVDFLTKPVAAEVLLAAVRAGVAQDARTREAQAESAALRKRIASLTPREREVLAAVAAGSGNKHIARALDLSLHTVKRHIANILDKLDCASRGQAAEIYRRSAS